MSNIISANDLKKHGVKAIDASTEGEHEALITVRGKNKYVVLPIETYNFLRECELATAFAKAQQEVDAGNYIEESVDEHIKRIRNV